MEEFIVNNYILIVVVCLFVIFTLIGYMADKKNRKNKQTKDINPNKEIQVNNTSQPEENVSVVSIEETKEESNDNIENKQEPTLDELIKQNSNISEVVQVPTEETNDETKEEKSSDEEQDNKNNEIVYNDWQPALEEENKDIITANSDIKEDSK